MKFMKKNFVSGWTNIKGKTPYAGTSNTHKPSYDAKCVTNCAGHHNVQMLFMTADGKVIHCLPGFWAPRYFLHEAKLATNLARLYYKRGSVVRRNEKYLNLHLECALAHDAALRHASQHQGFDKQNLEKRKKTDFKRTKGFIASGLKTPDQVMHERMAAVPFIPFNKFDIAKYVDMGRKRYQYNDGVPGKDKYRRKKTGRKSYGKKVAAPKP